MAKPLTESKINSILKSLQEEPAKSYGQIAKDYRVSERTVQKYAQRVGIHRKAGRKSWRVKVHPKFWESWQRRVAYTEARIREGLDRIYEEGMAGIQSDKQADPELSREDLKHCDPCPPEWDAIKSNLVIILDRFGEQVAIDL